MSSFASSRSTPLLTSSTPWLNSSISVGRDQVAGFFGKVFDQTAFERAPRERKPVGKSACRAHHLVSDGVAGKLGELFLPVRPDQIQQQPEVSRYASVAAYIDGMFADDFLRIGSREPGQCQRGAAQHGIGFFGHSRIQGELAVRYGEVRVQLGAAGLDRECLAFESLAQRLRGRGTLHTAIEQDLRGQSQQVQDGILVVQIRRL